MAYEDTHSPDAVRQQRDFRNYTIRIPIDLADALKRAASRRLEPQSVLVRRLVASGLHADQHEAK